jgi:hypothetical protein
VLFPWWCLQAPESIWRWEVASLERLPAASHALVKEARAARAELGRHIKALNKLIEARGAGGVAQGGWFWGPVDHMQGGFVRGTR